MYVSLLSRASDIPKTCLRLGIDSAVLAAPLRDLIAKIKSLTDQVPPDVWDFQAAPGDCLPDAVPCPLGRQALVSTLRCGGAGCGASVAGGPVGSVADGDRLLD
jgi:hypothetical protein